MTIKRREGRFVLRPGLFAVGAGQLTDNGQLGSVASEVLRGTALDLIAQRARVTDEAGRELDLGPPAGSDEDAGNSEDTESSEDAREAGTAE